VVVKESGVKEGVLLMGRRGWAGEDIKRGNKGRDGRVRLECDTRPNQAIASRLAPMWQNKRANRVAGCTSLPY